MATTDRRAVPAHGAGARAPAPGRGLPRFLLTAAGACATFVGALGFLSWQMSEGKDPALGGGFPAPQPPQVRRVLVRHVVETRVQRAEVIVRRRPAARAAAVQAVAAAAPPAPVGAVVHVSAPQPKPKPAPAAAEPAPAAKPAPAPEPAPTTHQS